MQGVPGTERRLFARHEQSSGLFLSGLSVGRVVLAALAGHAVRRDQLGRHQPHGVAVGLEQPGPIVRTRAGLHADHRGRQRRDQRAKFGTRDHGLAQQHCSPNVVTMHGKNILRQIDTSGNNGHGTSASE